MHIEDDEEAELQLLAQLLFRAPGRGWHQARIGTPLEAVSRSMEAWLCMISGRPVGIAPSDPSCTDGERIFLPRAMPAPSHAQESAAVPGHGAHSTRALTIWIPPATKVPGGGSPRSRTSKLLPPFGHSLHHPSMA